GYEVVFADVNAQLIDALSATPSYQVHEVGPGATVVTVDGYRAINSQTHEADVIAEIASAQVVTTAVGPTILGFVAPVIAAAIAKRDPRLPPLAVMACENAINATDALKAGVVAALPDAALVTRAVFANTAVDRIVPGHPHVDGLDVTVEAFFEWAIESGPFGAAVPVIPQAHFVDDLRPYIERKLFTVNTGHATAAYHGFVAGVSVLSDALAIPSVFAEVRAVLGETKALLVAKHDFPADVQQAYLEQNLIRFANPELSDTVERVGRQPLRKLSRNERFIGPAAQLAERGLPFDALGRAIGAALRFDVPDDPQSVELAALLASVSAKEFVRGVTGIDEEHPLFAALVQIVAEEQARR
ncbi:MAG TPA: mannitol-1-phosphate 5-dehydrogenase, partial [Microbacteriaceae bacterium]|nr:mannitol-1-phosphate 5-dehydrogenase [Microbacteriaceae bacterium]